MEVDSDIDLWCSEMLGDGVERPAQVGVEDGQAQQEAVDGVSGGMGIDDFVEFIKNAKPQHVIVENVPNFNEGQPVMVGQPSSSANAGPDAPFKAPSLDQHILDDPVYGAWVNHVRRPLEPVIEARGGFGRELVAASLFGGLNSDRKIMDIFKIPNKWVLSCDKAEHLMPFLLNNFVKPDVHVMEAAEFLNDLKVTNVFTGEIFDIRTIPQEFIDVLTVTAQCTPFSTARVKRKTEGTKDHPDAQLVDIFFLVAGWLQPKAILFEQVFGFALKESTTDSVTPLERFIENCDTLMANYEVLVFFAEGKAFLVFARHRVYIVMIMQKFNTDGTSEVIKRLVMARRNNNV